MLHEALRLVRQFHALSLSELAQRLSVSKSHLSEIEHGHKAVSLDLLQRYADVFNMPRSHLLLFAERVASPNAADPVMKKVAGKALKMLQWVEIVTRDERSIAKEDA
jgi:transcriptional regulator with XRE-family HTH domain